MTAWKAGQAELRDTIRACAADREMPARVLATALDVKTEVVHALLGGYRQWWLEAVEVMADLFEMSVDELVGDGTMPLPKAQIKRGRQAAPVPATKELPGKIRALCCTCGTMTRVKRSDVQRDEGDPAQRQRVLGETFASSYRHDLRLAGRAMYPTWCETCKTETAHALLRDHWKKDRDWIETHVQQPSVDDVARRDRDALVRRMEGFGVEFHWRPLADAKWREKHFTPVLGAEWDASKSVWRVEINPEYAPTFQLDCLEEAWEAIALNKTDWWPTDAETGAWLAPRRRSTEVAIDGLIDEIHNAAPAVLTSIVLDTTTDQEVDR